MKQSGEHPPESALEAARELADAKHVSAADVRNQRVIRHWLNGEENELLWHFRAITNPDDRVSVVKYARLMRREPRPLSINPQESV